MKIKPILIYISIVAGIFIVSECVNYFFNSSSPSSVILNRYFIDKSISEAKKGNLDGSINYLSIASKINTIGEYGPYRKLLPSDYSEKINFPQNETLKTDVLSYLANISPNELLNNEDQGLAWVFYNLALIGYKNNSNIAEEFFKKAVYNYPEFPSFHAELINYYYVQNKLDDANQAMEYCQKFKDPATLCNKYKDDINRYNTPQIVGYMKAPIKSHYISQ